MCSILCKSYLNDNNRYILIDKCLLKLGVSMQTFFILNHHNFFRLRPNLLSNSRVRQFPRIKSFQQLTIMCAFLCYSKQYFILRYSLPNFSYFYPYNKIIPIVYTGR